jgi:hypothetical protein
LIALADKKWRTTNQYNLGNNILDTPPAHAEPKGAAQSPHGSKKAKRLPLEFNKAHSYYRQDHGNKRQ